MQNAVPHEPAASAATPIASAAITNLFMLRLRVQMR
jgi:hypothetical protein